jgi:general secretion pathway protein D
METIKPIYNSLFAAAFLASIGTMLPLSGGDSRSGIPLASDKSSRSKLAIDEAQELLRKGDEAYTAGRYAEAVEAYAGAREMIPDAPITAELRAAATERFAQASVEQARMLSRNGDVAGARALVNQVLVPTVAPSHPGAVTFLGQLDDPIRTNPASNAAHTQDVDSVRRLLYMAEGAYNLGKFDEANVKYSEVLRIDSTNTAARRGMERILGAKGEYQKSAYDHTRAEMLNQVESQWELQVPDLALEGSIPNPGGDLSSVSFVSVSDKLDRIIIPSVALDQTSLSEAIDFLRIRANENDTVELDPARRGVNFTVSLGAPDSPVAQKINAARFDLQLKNVPLSQILTYIGRVTGTTFATDEFSVIITPVGSSSPDLISRTYRVPPDFMSSMSVGADATAATDDPFGAAPSSGGLLAKRLSAQEVLTKQGVDFPGGSSASYMAASNTLRVVNTASNHDFIAQVVDAIARVEPVMVSVKITMIKVEQTRLEELGFDWFLENANFKGNLVGAGGTVGNGRGASDVVGPNGATPSNPVTAGNRTGDSAISGNSLDNLLTTSRGRQASNPAPGILGLYGNFNDATVATLMRGLDQKKGVDILAQPATVTRSGQSSNIEIVREFIYPTEYEPPELPNTIDSFGGGSTPVTPATPTAFETKKVGITLEVLPVVDASKQYITVTLNPIFSEFQGFVNYGSPINSTVTNSLGIQETVVVTENAILMPVFSKDTVSTTVDVLDGSTVAVGGLVQETSQVVNDKTPILGSIPIVGRLFQSDARQPVKKMIIFLVNVELMDPTGTRFRNR